MFVRKVMAVSKPNSISKFSHLMEQEIIPMLRKEKGFQDGLSFFAPGDVNSTLHKIAAAF